MAATAAQLCDVGYLNMTIEGVAARAGVGKSTIYRWWPSKAALVVETLKSRSMLSPIELTGDSRADLRAVIASTFQIVTHSPAGMILPALAVDLIRDPAAHEQLHALLRPRRESVLTVIRTIAARGDLPADVDAGLLLDIYSGTLLYRVLLSGEPVTESIIDQLTDLLLSGTAPHILLML
ncbi:TetR/AcrR family transcriptional regulator [Pseudonocardia broussonetiae]|uniref:TetR/AcrR family transcriptional regulator n=1 Tax=Pseudonocardia broussonetiae TaxID=2736640 RepID=A0A6M6JDM1_9PSEU|nr:TetR/AcrR family transcriptional regulator [Pseudonocardia broussonetiae]QJY45115.1 TetR/AcrR family transcriptional regulator [Pseudonocardia broussonetiae]